MQRMLITTNNVNKAHVTRDSIGATIRRSVHNVQ